MGLTWKNMTAQQELSFRGGYAMRPRENSWKIWPRDGEEEVIGCPSETGMIRNPPCLGNSIYLWGERKNYGSANSHLALFEST